MSAKNPKRPPVPLTLTAADCQRYGGPLFRIHSTDSEHPAQWDGLREFGPLASMRWDPHPDPRRTHPGIGVAYTGTDSTTAFAEVFQSRRAIHLTAGRTLSAWLPARDLLLLDLTGSWPVRHGASASLHAAPRSTCRTSAREIQRQLGDRIDGMYVPSTMTLQPMVVLLSPAASSFPTAPDFSRPLTHSAVRMLAAVAADSLGWPII